MSWCNIVMHGKGSGTNRVKKGLPPIAGHIRECDAECMTFLSRPSDKRVRWDAVPDLPEVWCATVETAFRAEEGLSAFLYCARPDEDKVSIRVHLRFGPVPAFWMTEHLVDPWQDGPAPCPTSANAGFSPPLLEVRPSSWLASFAPGRLPDPPGSAWRHFEIVSSDAIFHVISTGRLDLAYFVTL